MDWPRLDTSSWNLSLGVVATSLLAACGPFVVLEGVALLRHGDALDWSGWQAAAYIAGLAWIALVSGWILALRAAGAGGRGSSR